MNAQQTVFKLDATIQKLGNLQRSRTQTADMQFFNETRRELNDARQTITNLQSELAVAREKYDAAKAYVRSVAAENERLWQELENKIPRHESE